MKEYDFIDIIFENCSVVRLKQEDILFISLDGIKDEIWINMSGQLIQHKYCESARIVIKNSAEKTDMGEHESFKTHNDVYRDITGISIVRNGKDNIYILVPYDGEDDNYIGSPNKFQRILREQKDQPFTIPSFTIEIERIHKSDILCKAV